MDTKGSNSNSSSSSPFSSHPSNRLKPNHSIASKGNRKINKLVQSKEALLMNRASRLNQGSRFLKLDQHNLMREAKKDRENRPSSSHVNSLHRDRFVRSNP